MKFLILGLIAAPLIANAPSNIDSGSLSSSDASYDGNSLLLTGQFVQLN